MKNPRTSLVYNQTLPQKWVFLAIPLLSVCILLCPSSSQGQNEDAKVQFQDPKAQTPVSKERILTIQLPILEISKITLTTRDPFVSAEVRDPYVTDSPVPEKEEEKTASQELVVALENALAETLSKSLKVRGVSSGEPEKTNFALIEGALPESDYYDGGPRLHTPGDTLTLLLDNEALQKLLQIALHAKEQGFIIDIGIPLNVEEQPTMKGQAALQAPPQSQAKTQILLKKIDRRSVIFEHTITEKEFEIPFEKDLRIRPLQNNPNNPQGIPTPNTGGPAPPPKI